MTNTGSIRNVILAFVILLSFTVPSIAEDTRFSQVLKDVRAGTYAGVKGMMISVGDKVYTSHAASGSAERRQDIRSATKSITAILVGELIEDGALKNERLKLSSILVDEFHEISIDDPKRKISIKDLLTMQGGLACNDWVPASVGHEDKMYKRADWVAFWLSQPVAYEPGKHFSYCTGGVVALGRVIEKLSGKTVPAFAQERLFGPLGITSAKWEETPTGYTDTGGHLHLTLEDFHKIGLLLRAGGVWQGERLISKSWMKRMINDHARVPERPETYGYLWWRMSFPAGDTGETVQVNYAHGNGGNFTFFVPDYSLVASFTAVNYGDAKQFIPMRILAREILPEVQKNPD